MFLDPAAGIALPGEREKELVIGLDVTVNTRPPRELSLGNIICVRVPIGGHVFMLQTKMLS